MIKIVRPCLSMFTSGICLIYIYALFPILDDKFILLIVGSAIVGANFVLNLIEVINLLGGVREQ